MNAEMNFFINKKTRINERNDKWKDVKSHKCNQKNEFAEEKSVCPQFQQVTKGGRKRTISYKIETIWSDQFSNSSRLFDMIIDFNASCYPVFLIVTAWVWGVLIK